MTNSPAPGTPQTALKAHLAGLLTTVAAMGVQYVSGRLGMQVDPTGAVVQHGVGMVQALGESAALGATAWLSAFFARNSVK